jgi:HlyD family secretion protein
MKRTSKKPFLIIAAVVVLVVVAIIFFNRKPFLYSGQIEATEIDVPARVASVIASMDAEEGSDIEAGKTVATLACEDVKLDAELAESNYERAIKLFQSDSMPKENFDRIKNTRNEAVLRRSWCNITAPVSGTVLDRYREPGEWASPGMKLLTLADLSRVYAYVYVPEILLARLKHGMDVTGYLPELKMKAVPGKIAAIREKAEFTPKNVQTREERTRLVYAVKIVFDNHDRVLKPGMSIEVQLPEI